MQHKALSTTHPGLASATATAASVCPRGGYRASTAVHHSCQGDLCGHTPPGLLPQRCIACTYKATTEKKRRAENSIFRSSVFPLHRVHNPTGPLLCPSSHGPVRVPALAGLTLLLGALGAHSAPQLPPLWASPTGPSSQSGQSRRVRLQAVPTPSRVCSGRWTWLVAGVRPWPWLEMALCLLRVVAASLLHTAPRAPLCGT